MRWTSVERSFRFDYIFLINQYFFRNFEDSYWFWRYWWIVLIRMSRSRWMSYRIVSPRFWSNVTVLDSRAKIQDDQKSIDSQNVDRGNCTEQPYSFYYHVIQLSYSSIIFLNDLVSYSIFISRNFEDVLIFEAVVQKILILTSRWRQLNRKAPFFRPSYFPLLNCFVMMLFKYKTCQQQYSPIIIRFSKFWRCFDFWRYRWENIDFSRVDRGDWGKTKKSRVLGGDASRESLTPGAWEWRGAKGWATTTGRRAIRKPPPSASRPADVVINAVYTSGFMLRRGLQRPTRSPIYNYNPRRRLNGRLLHAPRSGACNKYRTPLRCAFGWTLNFFFFLSLRFIYCNDSNVKFRP